MSSQDTSPTPYDRRDGVTIYHESTSVVTVIEGITIVGIFLGALVANLIAMVTILRDKVLRRNLHNWLILSLIINDLGFTIMNISFLVVTVFDQGYFLLHNKAVCYVQGNILFALGNFLTVLAISVDRYLAVVWSTRFPPSKSRSIVFIVFCWVAAIGSSFIPFLFRGVSSISYKTISHSCSPDFRENCFYGTTRNVIIFLVIVPTMVLCYVGVFLKVLRQQRLLRSYADAKPSIMSNVCSVEDNDDDDHDHVTHTDHDMQMDDIDQSIEGPTCSDLTPGPMDYSQSSNIEEPDAEHAEGENEGNKTIQQENVMTGIKKKDRRSMQKKLNVDKRVALTGTLLVLTTLVCWLPYCIVNSCLLSINIPHWMGVVTVWLAYSNSLFDPLIYTFMNRRIAARYRDMFRRWSIGLNTLIRCNSGEA
ncbi:5-hydroxytryptamine receptor 1-like [Strongylocentrotus purpuratus]|uniref:G-protein coupled receptors family 1 profile domain-containing protein n=1 Tax=Strongylocentrotus purpuratus TaxID=7668 RepID=A0A7M7NSZ6_STRPU|nr:5-hydroxytryptamine receptor 1-like [Strongylocentrotus purpuratus]